jgi:hypothetical protein
MWSESPPRSSLPKEVYADADVIEKARAMIRAGGGDAFVSDYLGMAAAQVTALRQSLTGTTRGRPAASVGAGSSIGAEQAAEAAARRRDAERGSAALLAAIRRYFTRHHPRAEARLSNESGKEQG